MKVSEKQFEPDPYPYYCDPLEGKDFLGNATQPSFYAGITEEIDTREKMLARYKTRNL